MVGVYDRYDFKIAFTFKSLLVHDAAILALGRAEWNTSMENDAQTTKRQKTTPTQLLHSSETHKDYTRTALNVCPVGWVLSPPGKEQTSKSSQSKSPVPQRVLCGWGKPTKG